MIKEYFVNYYKNQSQLQVSLKDENVTVLKEVVEPWRVTMVDTGLETLTAGRILNVWDYIGDEPFFLTYGDGVSDVNIKELLSFHEKNGRLLTISTTQPEGRI